MTISADRAPDGSSADVGVGSPAAQRHVDTPDASTARRMMIDSQLRTSGVNEPWVLAAMLRVAREDFVPAAMRDAAYIDRAIPLGDGRALAAPVVHGRMLAEAMPRTSDRALLVGDGAGYLAALLRPMVGTLASVAPGQAPDGGDYTLVVIDGAAEQVPEVLVAAMAEGGRIVTGLVERGVTRVAIGRRVAGTTITDGITTSNGVGNELALLPVAEMGIPVLSELATPKRWSF